MSIKSFSSQFLRLLRYANAFAGGAFLLLLLAMAVNVMAFTGYQVDGHSMEPTLHDGNFLGVNLLAYRIAVPQVDDVVIVRYSGDRSIRFVKRVVGVPGMRVPYKGENITLGSDEYFVEGDNRDFSTDSRAYGPVKRGDILGRVVGH